MIIDIEKAYEKYLSYVDTYLPDRKDLLHKMYDDLGERLVLSPASSFEHFHNAFPGGYIDHVLRVTNNALILYKTYEELGMDTSGYTVENIVFSALHHDLGKLGLAGEGNELYLENKNAWSRKNKGQIYEKNKNIPFALISDRSLFILQSYGVPVQWEEYLAIRIHDGLYEDANKAYYISHYDAPKMQTTLPLLIHMADMLAARQEFEVWKKTAVESDPAEKVNMNYGKRAKATKLGELATSGMPTTDPAAAFNELFGIK